MRHQFWPGALPASLDAIALLIIDMQIDFCAPGGWVDQLGEDVSNTRAVIKPIARVLNACRLAGLSVIHTREGHKQDLLDLHPNKQWRTRVHGLGIGDRGATGRILVRGEPGWEIVPELAPRSDELIVDKPGKSSFHATDLERMLRARGITHLVISGVTSDCCVQSTLRDGVERGFACVLLADCTAAVEMPNHEATLAILGALGGGLSRVSNSDAFLQSLVPLRRADRANASPLCPQIPAVPYAWPFDGPFAPGATALLLVGFSPARIEQLAAQEALRVATKLGEEARRAGLTVIVSTGEGAVSDLATLADVTVSHSGENAFFGTDLEFRLHQMGIRNLIIGGLPTEGLMHASMRSANDMGFECLAVADACRGTTEAFHEAQLRITTFGNGLFGAVATSPLVLSALRASFPQGQS